MATTEQKNTASVQAGGGNWATVGAQVPLNYTTTPHTTTFDDTLYKYARAYARFLDWPMIPLHNAIFDEAGQCVGCTCEAFRRSEDCKQRYRARWLAPGESCRQPGKCPRVAWTKRSSVKTEFIREWWGRYRRDVHPVTGEVIFCIPGIAVDCGKADILGFDADLYKQVGDLLDIIPRDEQETVTNLSGGGGTHLIFDADGAAYGNSTRGLPAGIDIRGKGGYLILPPTMHSSGRRYEWEEGFSPSQIPLRPIPPTLHYILGASQQKQRKVWGKEAAAPEQKIADRADLVGAVLKAVGEKDTLPHAYLGAGLCWTLVSCPFCPSDDIHADDGSAYVAILPDGAIVADCHHNRCKKVIESSGLSGWRLLRQMAGLVTQRPSVERPSLAAMMDYSRGSGNDAAV